MGKLLVACASAACAFGAFAEVHSLRQQSAYFFSGLKCGVLKIPENARVAYEMDYATCSGEMR